MIKDWEVLNRRLVNDFGIVKIHTKQARSPRTGDVRDILAIDFPDWALVLAITPPKEVVMVNQYRHGIERVCLELPGGLIDPQDPSPDVAAGRELLEETGWGLFKRVQRGHGPLQRQLGVCVVTLHPPQRQPVAVILHDQCVVLS